MRRLASLPSFAALAGLAAVLALAVLPYGAAAQSGTTAISIEPSQVELIGDTGPQVIRATVQSPTPGTVTLSLRDAITGPDGVAAEAPFGTMPATLVGSVDVGPTTFDYVPEENPTPFTASLPLTAGPVEEPKFGYLVAELTAADGTVLARDVVPVIAIPGAGALAALPEGTLSLAVDDLDIGADGFTIVDRLLPDLPGLIGHGPLLSRLTVRNDGSSAIETRVSWTYHRLGLSDLFSPESQPTLSMGTGSRLLVPGEVTVTDMSSALTFDSGPFDAMPIVGLVRVRATVEGTLPGVTTGPITVSRTLFVFPWSEVLVGLACWLAYRRRFGKVLDLRYSNEPIPVGRGAHRVSVWQRLDVSHAMWETFDLIAGSGRGRRRAR